jgi:hypothetical protein
MRACYLGLHAGASGWLRKIFMTALARPYRPIRKLMLDGFEVYYGIKSERRFSGFRQPGDGYCHCVFLFGPAWGA